MVHTRQTNDTWYPVVVASASSAYVGGSNKPFGYVVGRTVIYAGMILISSSFLSWPPPSQSPHLLVPGLLELPAAATTALEWRMAVSR